MKIHAIHVTVAAPRTLAALALAAASFVGGCFQPNAGTQHSPDTVFVLPDSNLSAVLRDANDDFASELDEHHVVGASDCPQQLGTLTVDNESDQPALARVELLGEGLALDLSSAEVEVAPGESAEITIAFNCEATDDIDTTMALSLEVGGQVGVFDIPLALDVIF
jgi:hypothetical protein